MNVLSAALRRAADDLSRRRSAWALVGGFAVSARSEPRFTRDVDIAVAVDGDAAAERLVHSLLTEGYQVVATVEQAATGRLATVRLVSPVGGDVEDGEVIIDLLFASSGIENEIALAAETIEIAPGLSLPVAQTGHLIALKVLARDDDIRPQDLADLRALAAVATPDDLAMTREALVLISRRGYHRGRDLAQALDSLLSSS